MNRRGFLKGLFGAAVAAVVPVAIVKTVRDPHWGLSIYDLRMKYARDAGEALDAAIDRNMLDQLYLMNNPVPQNQRYVYRG